MGDRGEARSGTATYYRTWGRLSTAQTADLTSANTWKLQWTYDRLGNRLSQTEPGGTLVTTQPSLSVSTTTNRITTSGYGYDPNGSLTADALHSFTYDDDNWVTSVDSGAVAVTYDANGLMVKKVAGGATTVYVYSGAALIAEYDGTGAMIEEHVNLSGVPLATLTPGGAAITYHASDQLSIRVDSDKNGSVAATQGNLPFGESWYTSGTPSEFRFTNYIRDTTSGLDFAPYRSYEARIGVYSSRDPLGKAAAFLRRPSTLSLYHYVAYDPINSFDPLGLDGPIVDPNYGGSVTVTDTYDPVQLAGAGALGGTGSSLGDIGGASGGHPNDTTTKLPGENGAANLPAVKKANENPKYNQCLVQVLGPTAGGQAAQQASTNPPGYILAPIPPAPGHTDPAGGQYLPETQQIFLQIADSNNLDMLTVSYVHESGNFYADVYLGSPDAAAPSPEVARLHNGDADTGANMEQCVYGGVAIPLFCVASSGGTCGSTGIQVIPLPNK